MLGRQNRGTPQPRRTAGRRCVVLFTQVTRYAMLRMFVLFIALAGVAGSAAAQETPSWISAPEVRSEDPNPPPPPPDPPQVPIDGGLVWLALAGGGYAA